ncbi:MAG: hypothetical protein ACRCU3_09125 [Eubacteriaceae bacterium]
MSYINFLEEEFLEKEKKIDFPIMEMSCPVILIDVNAEKLFKKEDFSSGILERLRGKIKRNVLIIKLSDLRKNGTKLNFDGNRISINVCVNISCDEHLGDMVEQILEVCKSYYRYIDIDFFLLQDEDADTNGAKKFLEKCEEFQRDKRVYRFFYFGPRLQCGVNVSGEEYQQVIARYIQLRNSNGGIDSRLVFQHENEELKPQLNVLAYEKARMPVEIMRAYFFSRYLKQEIEKISKNGETYKEELWKKYISEERTSSGLEGGSLEAFKLITVGYEELIGRDLSYKIIEEELYQKEIETYFRINFLRVDQSGIEKKQEIFSDSLKKGFAEKEKGFIFGYKNYENLIKELEDRIKEVEGEIAKKKGCVKMGYEKTYTFKKNKNRIKEIEIFSKELFENVYQQKEELFLSEKKKKTLESFKTEVVNFLENNKEPIKLFKALEEEVNKILEDSSFFTKKDPYFTPSLKEEFDKRIDECMACESKISNTKVAIDRERSMRDTFLLKNKGMANYFFDEHLKECCSFNNITESEIFESVFSHLNSSLSYSCQLRTTELLLTQYETVYGVVNSKIKKVVYDSLKTVLGNNFKGSVGMISKEDDTIELIKINGNANFQNFVWFSD